MQILWCFRGASMPYNQEIYGIQLKKKKTMGDWREDVHSINFLGKSKFNYMKPWSSTIGKFMIEYICK